MELIDGKKVSETIQQQIAAKVVALKARGEKVPHLAAILWELMAEALRT